MKHPEQVSYPFRKPPPQARRNTFASLTLDGLALAAAASLTLTACGKPKENLQLETAANPSVGAEALYTLILNRGDVIAAAPAENAPLTATIKSIQTTGNQKFTYIIAYLGTEKGTFNLTDYLSTPNGVRLREPITPVQVDSFVPDSAEYAIRNLPIHQHPAPPPYTAMLYGSGAAWLLLGLWMFLPRGRKRPASPPPQPTLPARETPQEQTLEDLLRPLVEKAAQKTITTPEKSRMEQILFNYWGALLELDHLNSVEQLRRILEHEEAGALLRTVEQWLYQPESEIPVEAINEILKPYMNLPITAEIDLPEGEPVRPRIQS
jgi:hypothetical protein